MGCLKLKQGILEIENPKNGLPLGKIFIFGYCGSIFETVEHVHF